MKTRVKNSLVALAATVGAFSTMTCLTACEDSLTEAKGQTSVATVKDLGDCDKSNEGELVYVKEKSSIYLCADSTWKTVNVSVSDGKDGANGKDGSDGKDGKNGTNGVDGKDGKNGADGKSCTVKEIKNGYKVLCGGDSVGVLLNGKDGKNGVDGKDGKDGDNGTSCTVKENKEKNGFDLVCGDKKVTITNGKDGQDGKPGEDGASITGPQGESCKGEALENGDIKITCGETEVGVLKNGTAGTDGSNGEPGKSCTVKENAEKNGYDLECDGKVVTVTNGTPGVNGESCTIAEDKGGVVTLQCGEGENAKTTKLYKALCGSDPYDPETQRCVDGSVFGKCGKGTYIENVEFCYDGEAYPLCGKDLLEYNPNREACKDGVVLSLCGTKTFDPAVYACVSGMILPLCVNEPYNPDLQECDDETGSVTDKYVEYCGTKPYDPNIKFCDDRDGENVIYGMVTVTHSGMGYSETWMTDNLRYKTKTGSVCHPDDNDACTEYGRFYVWDAAMWVDDDIGNYVDICPDGWQLPTYEQYVKLAQVFGGAERAGIPLKSKDWDGTNESGLNILEAGYVEIKNNAYVFNNDSTSFWTRNYYNSSIAFSFDVHDGKKNLAVLKQDKKLPKSVRCIKKKTNK